jgi:large subunit ribosomal protein L16
MLLFPKKQKFIKSFTGIKLSSGNTKAIQNHCFGQQALIAKTSGIITNFQLEAIRRFLRRKLKKKAQIFFRVFPQYGITKKPNDVRLGRGKGNPKYYACLVKKGSIILELRPFSNKNMTNILKQTQYKLRLQTHISKQSSR